jgi:two-component system OmpR family response regulator
MGELFRSCLPATTAFGAGAAHHSVVLLVSADTILSNDIVGYLTEGGLAVTSAPDLAHMEATLLSSMVGLIILDSLPLEADGFSLCCRLVALGGPPVLLLTPGAEAIDRIVGLEIGADDCLGRPYDPRELLARARALLRRRRSVGSRRPPDGSDDLTFSGWRLSPKSRLLYDRDHQAQRLAPSELDLLLSLLKRPREVLLRSEIRAMLGGRDQSDRLIDTRVTRLRSKLGQDGPRLIRTVYGLGYQLDSAVAPWPHGVAPLHTTTGGS